MRSDIMSKYLIPSLKEIKELYNEIIPMMKSLKTKDDIINFEKEHKVTMEINRDYAINYDEKEPIEYIRCESWNDLDYIYVYSDNSEPLFDVWCDFMEYDFIQDTTIENLEQNYIKGIKMLWYRSDTRKENLMEIIRILRQQGIEYNYMIDTFDFDVDIVEEYESKHYEWGIGDIK